MFEIKHTLCPSCSVGCGINVILNNNEIVGTFPYKRHPVNEGKNCANGRKAIDNYKNKLESPIIAKSESDLDKALGEINNKLKSADSKKVTILMSGSNSLEEVAAIKSFAEKSNFNIAFYADDLNQGDVATYDEIENAESVFVIGDILFDNPLIGRKIVHAKQNGAKIYSNIKSDSSVTANISDETNSESINEFIDKYSSNLNKNSIIIFNYVDGESDLKKISETGVRILPVFSNCNTKGTLSLLESKSKQEITDILNSTDVLLTFNNDADFDISGISTVIAISSFKNNVTDIADIIIPVKSWLETEGSFVNAIGSEQKFTPVIETEDILTVEELIEKIDLE